MLEPPRCTWRDHWWIEKGPDEPKRDGSWGPRTQFHGTPICGAPATVSLGGGRHLCLRHLRKERLMRSPHEGRSADPRAIGGSDRYRYKI
jgi:hypothetical protein